MLDHAAGAKGIKEIWVPDKMMHREAVGDTGATVCCYGPDTMEQMEIKVQDFLATYMSLFAADNKNLTVLGALPVMTTAPTRYLLYIVEELTCVFLSRVSLADLGSISECFPMVRDPRAMEW